MKDGSTIQEYKEFKKDVSGTMLRYKILVRNNKVKGLLMRKM
jgi:hypothetical protein